MQRQSMGMVRSIGHLRYDRHGFVQTAGKTAFVECPDDDSWVPFDTRLLPSHLLLPPSRHRNSRFASHQSTLLPACQNLRTTQHGVASRRFGLSVVLKAEVRDMRIIGQQPTHVGRRWMALGT